MIVSHQRSSHQTSQLVHTDVISEHRIVRLLTFAVSLPTTKKEMKDSSPRTLMQLFKHLTRKKTFQINL